MGLPINVFPVTQGFPKPPDGGTPASAATRATAVAPQALAPAAGANLLPSEPPAPLAPFQPSSQAAPPAPVLSQAIPSALDVNTMLATNPDAGAPTFVVTDLGSYAGNQSTIMKNYDILSVVDYYAGGVPNASTLYLKISLGGGAPFSSYGVSLAGRSLLFLTLNGNTPNQPAERPILTYGDLGGGVEVLVVPNTRISDDGIPFTWPLGPCPAPGDVVSIDVARYNDEAVSQLTGQVQNITPQTTPLPPQLGVVYSNLPIQDVDVSDQEPVLGTPINVRVP